MGNEIWKPVVGYEGRYEVSNLGRIKSLPKYHAKECRILHPTKNVRDGRLSVMLTDINGNHKRIFVHKLVGTAFCDNPFGYKEINHKDENPANNNAENLEWCTRKYNMNYGTTPKRLNEKNKKPIYCVDRNGERTDFPYVRCAKQYGYDSSGIIKAIKRCNLYKGKRWFYAN